MQPDPKWYVAVTQPKCEAKVRGDLQMSGYRAFFATRRTWVSHARTKRVKDFPVFPRYLFVEVDYPRQGYPGEWVSRDLESILGVGAPEPLPDNWVMDLMRRQMTGEFDETKDGPIPVSARIRIAEGKFANALATVTGYKRGMLVVKPQGQRESTRVSAMDVVPA